MMNNLNLEENLQIETPIRPLSSNSLILAKKTDLGSTVLAMSSKNLELKCEIEGADLIREIKAIKESKKSIQSGIKFEDKENFNGIKPPQISKVASAVNTTTLVNYPISLNKNAIHQKIELEDLNIKSNDQYASNSIRQEDINESDSDATVVADIVQPVVIKKIKKGERFQKNLNGIKNNLKDNIKNNFSTFFSDSYRDKKPEDIIYDNNNKNVVSVNEKRVYDKKIINEILEINESESKRAKDAKDAKDANENKDQQHVINNITINNYNIKSPKRGSKKNIEEPSPKSDRPLIFGNEEAKDNAIVLKIKGRTYHIVMNPGYDVGKLKASSKENYVGSFPFRICILCDQFHSVDTTFSSEICDHNFCYKCGKQYFEDKIENGNIDFFGKPFKVLQKINEEEHEESKERKLNLNYIDPSTIDYNNIQKINNNINRISGFTINEPNTPKINKTENINIYDHSLVLHMEHFYCPVFKCDGHIDSLIIRGIIGEGLYNSYLSKLKKLKKKIDYIKKNEEEKLEIENIFKSSINPGLEKKNTAIDATNIRMKTLEELRFTSSLNEYKLITKKHFLQVKHGNEIIENSSKHKHLICSKCSLPALYGKSGNFYLKCLGCLQTVCRFCFKPLTSDHFDITSLSNYCKVYFRKKLKKNEKNSSEFIEYVVAFVIVLLSMMLWFSSVIYRWWNLIWFLFFDPVDDIKKLINSKRLDCLNDSQLVKFKGHLFTKKYIMSYNQKKKTIMRIIKFIWDCIKLIIFLLVFTISVLIISIICWCTLMFIPFSINLGLI